MINKSKSSGKLSKLKSGEIWYLVQIGGGGRQKIKKVPSFSWEKFKIRVGSGGCVGWSSEIKKVPSSREYQRLKNNDSFSSYEDPKT